MLTAQRSADDVPRKMANGQLTHSTRLLFDIDGLSEAPGKTKAASERPEQGSQQGFWYDYTAIAGLHLVGCRVNICAGLPKSGRCGVCEESRHEYAYPFGSAGEAF